jgi:HK97 family phage major capsid protein
MSSVRRVSSSVYKRPFSTSGANAGWIAETAARAQTGTPGLSELAFPTMELFAMPAATMTLLDDAAVNIDDWLAEEVNGAFAAQESAAFVSGDGNGKPKGFLAYTAVANSSWTWGNMGYVATGVAGGFPASSAADKSSYHSPRQTDLSPARRMPVTSGVVRLWVRLVVRSETAKKTKSATLKNLRFHNKHRSFI